jgi:hypothetical protein
MKNVCALMGGCIGDSYVIGVFSSLKEANEAREWIIINDTYYKKNPNELYVDVFELDSKEYMNQFKVIDYQADFMSEEKDGY